jgi:clathrin heavy chain
VTDLINRLNNYNATNIAEIAINAQLYEEAFLIYKKQEMHVEAVNTLIEHIASIDRAVEYAERADTPEVWSCVAKAQLAGLRIRDAIGTLSF